MMFPLSLEAIGDDTVQYVRLCCAQIGATAGKGTADLFRWPARQWVAEIVATHPRFGFERRWVHGKKDYTQSNSVGSRGVYVHYLLESGKIYEVSAPRTWRKTDRYFARVDGDRLIRLTEEEVRSCLASGASA